MRVKPAGHPLNLLGLLDPDLVVIKNALRARSLVPVPPQHQPGNQLHINAQREEANGYDCSES